MVFVGAFLQSISGIGTGLVVVSVLPLFMTVKDTTLLILTILIFGGLTAAIKYYRYIEWKKIAEFLIYVLIGRLVAFFILTTYGELDVIKVWLGGFLFSVALYQLLLPRFSKKETTSKYPNRLVSFILGILAGIVGGLFGIGGMFVATFFIMLYPNQRFSYIVSIQVSAIISSIFSISLHAANRDIEASLLPFLIVGIIAVILGTVVGFKSLDKTKPQTIKRNLLILILIASLNLMLFS
ncbi:sulfite exporter TauE/SafE family protein [Alkalicoccobacillus gibsonii]|uniref:sulfite exporter TauE/SafE family protein n=1 Tax=Alkalicoccobacillus gibsonii TaxID=79881 RepID=UPI003F7C9FC2